MIIFIGFAVLSYPRGLPVSRAFFRASKKTLIAQGSGGVSSGWLDELLMIFAIREKNIFIILSGCTESFFMI
jgi:hypothetical protein